MKLHKLWQIKRIIYKQQLFQIYFTHNKENGTAGMKQNPKK